MSYEPTYTEATTSGRGISKRTVASYVLDWIIIIIIAGLGGFLYKTTGYNRAFSLEDPSISFPLTTDTISIAIVGIVACGVPAAIILILCLFIPSSSIEASSQIGPKTVWGRRLWEWHAGWLGLGLSLAGAFFVTSGLKDVVGKPRPDFIARCDPDLSHIDAYAVGGLGLEWHSAPVMVNMGICQNTDQNIVQNGFAAFPSGHSSFSWAGLLYLSLWLSAKHAVTFPVPVHVTKHGEQWQSRANPDQNIIQRPLRSRAAGPPLYLLLLTLTPVAVALFICATRYTDYMHAGWDIVGGSAIGIFFAWIGFRWYHISLGRCHFAESGGWAWAPRSIRTAFGISFGSPCFGRDEDSPRNVRTNTHGYEDLELGPLR